MNIAMVVAPLAFLFLRTFNPEQGQLLHLIFLKLCSSYDRRLGCIGTTLWISDIYFISRNPQRSLFFSYSYTNFSSEKIKNNKPNIYLSPTALPTFG